ncbi:RAxF-45 family protein [Bacillus sp. DX4.1]|nr:RAxF-45 family protein [Bacillus sp. DX4.1]MDM5186673.1 RAxF-45 family protein [Bacillus sp. DX4.1]
MKRSVAVRTQFLDFIYMCRAIFHGVVANGIRMPFFSNCITAIER